MAITILRKDNPLPLISGNNKMYALITRPLIDSEDLRTGLSNLGYVPILQPMFSISTNLSKQNELNNFLANDSKVVVITSKNAIRALKLMTNKRNIHLVTVGEESARLAKELGFMNVVSGPGNAACLADYLGLYYNKQELLYLSGNIIAANLPKILQNKGLIMERLAIYHANPCHDLSETLIEVIKNNQLRLAIFCSARTAEIFINLVKKYNIEQKLKDVVAYSLSKNIASKLHTINWQNIDISKNLKLVMDKIREHSGKK